jgi:hypothetical protein
VSASGRHQTPFRERGRQTAVIRIRGEKLLCGVEHQLARIRALKCCCDVINHPGVTSAGQADERLAAHAIASASS